MMKAKGGARAVNWTKEQSIRLSRFCVAFFALALAGADLGCYWLARWYVNLRGMSEQSGIGIMAVFYLCSVFAWIALVRLWMLLSNLKAERTFLPENVRHLRIVSWCCAGVAMICLLGCFFYPIFLFVAMGSAFVALIMRIVKNVFQQAIDAPSEREPDV